LLRRPSQSKEYDPDQYLRDADNRFVFDAESGIYKPKSSDEGKKRKKFKILSLSLFEWGSLLLGAATLIFLIKYTNYARLQWCAAQNTLGQIQQQTTLMRKQLVGTQAAIIPLALGYSESTGALSVPMVNDGHVTATDIHLTIDASQRRIKDDTSIGEPLHFEIPIQPIPSGKGPTLTWTMPWPLTEYERSQGGRWVPDWPGKRTFVFRASLAYQDGFDNEIHRDICKQWLPGFSIDHGGGRRDSGGGIYDCTEIKSIIRSTLEQERQAEKDTQKAK
jgi:hypothetical protein